MFASSLKINFIRSNGVADNGSVFCSENRDHSANYVTSDSFSNPGIREGGGDGTSIIHFMQKSLKLFDDLKI